MRPLEDGCCADGEVQLALIAAVEAALASRDAVAGVAGRANGTRPLRCSPERACVTWDPRHNQHLRS